MSRIVDLMKSFLRSIEDRPDCQDEEDVSDEDMDIADLKRFASWEARVSLMSPHIYDYDTREPALWRDVEKKARGLVDFFNDSGDVLDDYDGLVYGENGQTRENSLKAWAWSSLTELVTQFNMAFEENKPLEDVAEPLELIESDHYRILYKLLVDKAVCQGKSHSALLQLQSVDQSPETLDIYLSCSPDDPIRKHRTSIIIKRSKNGREQSKQDNGHDPLDICREIRTFCKYHHRPLYLVFDDSGIQFAQDPQREPLPPRTEPETKRLSDILQCDTLEAGDLKMSRLALELALCIHRMYAGPWIQHTLNAQVIKLLYEKEDTAPGDFTYACIPCELIHDWQATNEIWKESQEELNSERALSGFFLSLAQLLVDISPERKRITPLADFKAWTSSLVKEGDRMRKIKSLKWYGDAILSCVWFTYDYKLARTRDGDSTAIARGLILKNIVQNLWTHVQSWESQYIDRMSGSGVPNEEVLKHLKADKPRQRNVSKIPYRKKNEVPVPHIALFSPRDRKHDEVIEDEQLKPEFNILMKKFKEAYIVRKDSETDKNAIEPRAVVIAVLDTGVRRDESDTLLYDNERIIEDDSRDYFNSKGSMKGWDTDNHSHGTHIVRLLLQNTVSAKVIVLKVADDWRVDYSTEMFGRFLEALEWAGDQADIINLSIGLQVDQAAKDKMHQVIESIISRGKLIFAAAGNPGGNGRLAYPAREDCVFAIHATEASGREPAEDMNPLPSSDSKMGNFATFGCDVPSQWEGKPVLVTGTSFATAIAAAIAANALEFVRLAPTELQSSPGYFSSYLGMRDLLQAMSSRNTGGYDYIKPWADGMFDIEEPNVPDMEKKLQWISRVPRN